MQINVHKEASLQTFAQKEFLVGFRNGIKECKSEKNEIEQDRKFYPFLSSDIMSIYMKLKLITYEHSD